MCRGLAHSIRMERRYYQENSMCGVPVEGPISECVFVRSLTKSGMTVSVCTYCSHIIAAMDANALEIAEHSHLCAEMWLHTSEATSHSD